MDALDEAIDEGRGYPGGLFWFKRAADTPYQAVIKLVENARLAGIDAHFVQVETFDELFSDITCFLPETEKAAQSITDVTRPRLAKADFRAARSNMPAIRTNALPITSHPAVCRLVDCDIGGWEDIQAAITNSEADLLARRCSAGVLAFGSDADVRRTFAPYKIKAFDTYPITPERLAKQSGERNLIADALFRALDRRPGLRCERRGTNVLLFPDAGVVKSSMFHVDDTKAVDYISGTVRGTKITWSEACSIRLDYRLDRLWLLIEPIVKRNIPDETSEKDTFPPPHKGCLEIAENGRLIPAPSPLS